MMRLIDTPEFQRLRRIKQLGLGLYTYQGAEHSRFTHSLGAFHLMTRVLDRLGAKFEIHNIVRREASRGMACLVASSDLPEVLALADRILVIRDGRLQGELSGEEADEAQVMRLAAARPGASA